MADPLAETTPRLLEWDSKLIRGSTYQVSLIRAQRHLPHVDFGTIVPDDSALQPPMKKKFKLFYKDHITLGLQVHK